MNENLDLLLRKLSELEQRVQFLESRSVDPNALVSFVTVAICGKMNLQPFDMAPSAGFGPSTQVGKFGQMAYETDLRKLQGLAIRHGLLKEPGSL